jgi:hypothetical protein
MCGEMHYVTHAKALDTVILEMVSNTIQRALAPSLTIRQETSTRNQLPPLSHHIACTANQLPVTIPRQSSISKPESKRLPGLRRNVRLKASSPDEPSLNDAMRSTEADLWLVAMHRALQSLADHHTFSFVPRPIGVPVIKEKWVFKVKRNELGEIERHKARLVAKGFAQQ